LLCGCGSDWRGSNQIRNAKGFRRFDGGKGAYVYIAAWAESREALENRVQREAEEIDGILGEIDDAALLEKRLEAADDPEEFIDMSTTATNQPEAAAFGTFHIGMNDDSNSPKF
jgi:hypothetical protein